MIPRHIAGFSCRRGVQDLSQTSISAGVFFRLVTLMFEYTPLDAS